MDRKVALGGFLLLAMTCPWMRMGLTGAVARAQDTHGAQAKPEFPGFTVEIALSEKAMKKLAAAKETVVAAGYFSGNPKKDALQKFVSEIGDVNLGEMDVEVAPGESAKFGEIKLKKDALAQTDGQEPQLLINVFSGRKSSQDNLLDCGLYEGPLKAVQGKSIPIACKLIGE